MLNGTVSEIVTTIETPPMDQLSAAAHTSGATIRPGQRIPRATQHAIDRYIERVAPTCTRRDAVESINRLVSAGHARSTPRHWMRGATALTPGMRYVYSASQPGTCALVVGESVITIITRQMYRHAKRSILQLG